MSRGNDAFELINCKIPPNGNLKIFCFSPLQSSSHFSRPLDSDETILLVLRFK